MKSKVYSSQWGKVETEETHDSAVTVTLGDKCWHGGQLWIRGRQARGRNKSFLTGIKILNEAR